MIAKVHSQAVLGIDPFPVEVEVDVNSASGADHCIFMTVGLPDAAVRESRERVRAAMRNSNFFVGQVHITVNLAPADVRKEGAFFDLAIALAILSAAEVFSSARLNDYVVVGELSLDGRVKAIPGVLPLALGARSGGFRGIVVPRDNAEEAALVDGIDVVGVDSLAQAVAFLSGSREIPPTRVDRDLLFQEAHHAIVDFQDVKGQEFAKRALEVAAAGGHNILMIGPPGSGKTMLAKRLPTILPEMTFEEAIEATKIHSIAGLLDRSALIAGRPFRSPHHTISNIALIGGGMIPRPGEVSLAHHGVLFLDELPEFQRQVLEVLRQPLEDGKVNIARAQMSLTFPARFLLCAAMNPCPCGFKNHPTHRCDCQDFQMQRYLSRISGPLLDRIDLHVDVPAVPIEDLRQRKSGAPSAEIRQRVNTARQIQLERFKAEERKAVSVAMGAGVTGGPGEREKKGQNQPGGPGQEVRPSGGSSGGPGRSPASASEGGSGNESGTGPGEGVGVSSHGEPGGVARGGAGADSPWIAAPGDLFSGDLAGGDWPNGEFATEEGNGEMLGFPPARKSATANPGPRENPPPAETRPPAETGSAHANPADQSDPSDRSTSSTPSTPSTSSTRLPPGASPTPVPHPSPGAHPAPAAQPVPSSSAPSSAAPRPHTASRPSRSARSGAHGSGQHERIFCNAQMTSGQLGRYCELDGESQRMLESAIRSFGFSARAYDRIRKVARTIADLSGSETIQSDHVSEAVNYRSLDRNYWGGG